MKPVPPVLAVLFVFASTAPAVQVGSLPDLLPATAGSLPTRSGSLFVPAAKLDLDGFRLAFLVDEALHGDRNGDGDAVDHVLQVTNLATRQQTNTGLAVLRVGSQQQSFAMDGGHVLCLVSEADQGVDLNADGDQFDSVLHVFDASSGLATNLGVAGNPTDFRLRDGLCVVLVAEPVQGGIDLDGNGSTIDSVPHVWDAATGVLTNLAVPAASVTTAGGIVVYEATEVNGDLNGDGDPLDRVLHAYDSVTGTTTNFGTATYDPGFFSAPLRIAVSGTQALQLVGEAEQGQGSLNGDADATDLVLHVHDLVAGTTTNTALASGDYRPLAPYVVGERFAYFLVDEAAQGAGSLNADADVLDRVLFSFDAQTASTTNAGLAAQSLDADAALAVVLVREAGQGATDLNGDGDAVDFVPHVWDAGAQVSTAFAFAAQGGDLLLGLPAHPPRVGGGLVAFAVLEQADGATDRNGDGDTNDRVLFVYDSERAQLFPLSVAVPLLGRTFEPRAERVAFLVDEAGQAADLTGDGDQVDTVAQFWIRSSATARTTRRAALSNDDVSPFEQGAAIVCCQLQASPLLGFVATSLLAGVSAR